MRVYFADTHTDKLKKSNMNPRCSCRNRKPDGEEGEEEYQQDDCADYDADDCADRHAGCGGIGENQRVFELNKVQCVHFCIFLSNKYCSNTVPEYMAAMRYRLRHRRQPFPAQRKAKAIRYSSAMNAGTPIRRKIQSRLRRLFSSLLLISVLYAFLLAASISDAS